MRRGWSLPFGKSGERVQRALPRLVRGKTTIVPGGGHSPWTCCGPHPPRLPRLTKRLGLSELYTHFAQPGVWVLYEDARRCLDRLQGRFRLAVISNFDGRLRRVLDDLGVSARFESLFISSELGCEKPDRAIFRQALEVMDAKPDGAFMWATIPNVTGRARRRRASRFFE